MATALLLFLAVLAVVPVTDASSGPCPHTDYIGEHPDDEDDPDWTNNVQGVAHDAEHWYFTTTTLLLKLPVGHNLATSIDPGDYPEDWPTGSKLIEIPEHLQDEGYTHLGDPDQKAGFLFIPLTDEEDDVDVRSIAVFRTSDLSLVGLKTGMEESMAWAAFNPADGLLYMSVSQLAVRKFTVDFSVLESDVGQAIQKSGDDMPLREPDGTPATKQFQYLQGGTFTPWGDLYLSNGYFNDGLFDSDDDVHPDKLRGGLHVFEYASDFRLIEDSHMGGSGFNYRYDWSFGEWEEPEGLDWWHDPPSPGIGGQLHAVLLDNDGNEDDIFFKHYTVDYWCKAGDDSDGDGLEDMEEAFGLGTSPANEDSDFDLMKDGDEVDLFATDPLDPDSDDDGTPDGEEDADLDGLSDSKELYGWATDPFDSDSDDDGLLDGPEVDLGTNPSDSDTDDDGILDGPEVNVHGSDPLDPDSDDDLLIDGIEVQYGTDPVDADSDDDGLTDGNDVEFVQNAVNALAATSLSPPGQGTRKAILVQLDAVESFLLQGKTAQATKKLEELRKRMDGCGSAADVNDWIVVCVDQLTVRSLVDLLLANLSGA